MTNDALLMNGELFGPYSGDKATVPTSVGVYLYLKGLANIGV